MDCLPDLLQRNTRFNASAPKSCREGAFSAQGMVDTSSRLFGIVIHSVESPVRAAALRVKLGNR